MSAPSIDHARHVATLEALARLSGYDAPATLPGLVPDVLLARKSSLFIGEAKSTEEPSSMATRERLGRYMRHLARRHRLGDALVLCVSSLPAAWRDTVANLSCNVAGRTWHVEIRCLRSDEWLVVATPR